MAKVFISIFDGFSLNQDPVQKCNFNNTDMNDRKRIISENAAKNCRPNHDWEEIHSAKKNVSVKMKKCRPE